MDGPRPGQSQHALWSVPRPGQSQHAPPFRDHLAGRSMHVHSHSATPSTWSSVPARTVGTRISTSRAPRAPTDLLTMLAHSEIRPIPQQRCFSQHSCESAVGICQQFRRRALFHQSSSFQNQNAVEPLYEMQSMHDPQHGCVPQGGCAGRYNAATTSRRTRGCLDRSAWSRPQY